MMPDACRALSALIVGCGRIGRRHARIPDELGLRDIRVGDPDPAL